VIGVVRTNGFVVSDLEGRRLGNGLWGLASFFNHACWPNACVSFTQAPRKGGGSSSGGSNSGGSIGGGLVLEARALRDILLGEPITIGFDYSLPSFFFSFSNPLSLRAVSHCQCLF